VLIANGPQYKFNTVRVQREDGDTCGLYCVHFVKYRYRNTPGSVLYSVGELVGATHGRRQIFKVSFQFVAVGTFYPIVFSLASLGGRFVDGTSTYLVIFQTPRASEYESAGSLRLRTGMIP
jgi:hypothetical protein